MRARLRARVGQHVQVRAALTLLLGLIHRGVGMAQQALGVRGVGRIERDADAGAQVHLLPAHIEGRLEEIVHLGRKHHGVVGIALAVGEHDEFVATEARDGIRCAQAAVETVGDGLKHEIAGLVPIRVVDGLEAVEIHEQHGQLPPGALRDEHGLLEAIEQQRTVGQVGEAVVVRKLAHALLGRLALGDVQRDRHEHRRLLVARER